MAGIHSVGVNCVLITQAAKLMLELLEYRIVYAENRQRNGLWNHGLHTEHFPIDLSDNTACQMLVLRWRLGGVR